MVAGTGKSVRESAVEFETEMDRLDTIARAKAEQIAQTTQLAFNEFYGIDRPRKSAPQSGAVFSEDIAMEEDLARRRKAIMDTHLPMEVESDRTRDILKEINFLGSQKLLTQKQVNAALKAEELRHAHSKRSIEGMTVSQGKYASGVGLARNEVVNLSRQLQDVAVTLQMGQPLSTILMQQGTQIADIFASSNATFGGFVRQVGTGARFVATSFAGIAAGALAIGAGLSFAGLRFADGQREVERQLGGIGRASGATVQDINSVADALSRQQQISRGAAREIAGTFAATGMIRPNEIAGLSGMTRDFAAQTGQTDLAAAAKELAAAYADPAKGADTLNQKLGFLDARTRDYIRTLQDQNNRSEASIVLQKAMAESVSGAADRVSWLTRAWQGLRDAVANTIDSIGQAVAGEITLEQKLAQAIQQRSQLQSASGGWAARMGQVGQRTAAIDREIAAIQSQIAAEKQLQEERARIARERATSITADNLIEKVFPDLSRIRELRAAVVDLDAALSNPGVRSRLADVSEAQRAQEAFRNAVETSLTSAQRLTAEGDLAVKGIMARTLEEQKSVALERERLALAGQTVDKVDAELRLRNTMLQVQSNAAREARDALRSANDNAELAGLRPYQRAVREQEMRMRDLRERTEGGNIVPFTRGGQRDSNIAVTSAPAGMNADFAARVRALIAAVGDGGAVMTSGFRTREKQQELYDRYGPGRAAVPGTSQHEKGTAADYVFSTPEARRRALEMASQHGLRALPSNRGAVHFDMGRAGALAGGPAAGQSLDAYTAAANRGTEAANRFALQQQFMLVPLRESEDDLKKQTEVLALQEQAFSRSAFEIGRAAKEQELLSGFQQQGVEITDALRQSVAQLADDYGRLAERQISGKFSQDVLFEREQIFRTPGEAGIASRLRGTGIGMDSAVADMMRMNNLLGQIDQAGSSAFQNIADGIARGDSGAKILQSTLANLGSQLMQIGAQGLWKSLLSSAFSAFTGGFGGGGPGPPMQLMGSFMPFANGGVFSGGAVVPFAAGGVVSSPVTFPMAAGRTGLMGEAGPEAIMPLKRGANGALGVQVSGGATSSPITVDMGGINIVVQGSADGGTAQQVKDAADVIRKQLAKELPEMIVTAQRNRRVA